MSPSALASAITDSDGTRRKSARVDDDVALVQAAADGNTRACASLFRALAPRVESFLFRLLGPNMDLSEPLSETFERFFARLGTLEEPSRASSFCIGIAARVAREQLRAKRRRAWLSFLPWTDLPETPASTASISAPDDDARAALRRVFAILERFADEERLAFAMKHLQGCDLAECAEALDVSLSTLRRRLAAAEARFFAIAAGDPLLAEYANGQNQWESV